MSHSGFRCYHLSLQLYSIAKSLRLPAHLRDQLLRAASSITLNLAEGSAKATQPDRVKFYRISLGSQRECMAILDLISEREGPARQVCDQLGGHLYRLARSPRA